MMRFFHSLRSYKFEILKRFSTSMMLMEVGKLIKMNWEKC